MVVVDCQSMEKIQNQEVEAITHLPFFELGESPSLTLQAFGLFGNGHDLAQHSDLECHKHIMPFQKKQEILEVKNRKS